MSITVTVTTNATVTTGAAPQLGGAVVVTTDATVAAGELITDFPRAAPTDPTLTAPVAGEVAVQRVSDVYPDPTLVDGVPVGWGPT